MNRESGHLDERHPEVDRSIPPEQVVPEDRHRVRQRAVAEVAVEGALDRGRIATRRGELERAVAGGRAIDGPDTRVAPLQVDGSAPPVAARADLEPRGGPVGTGLQRELEVIWDGVPADRDASGRQPARIQVDIDELDPVAVLLVPGHRAMPAQRVHRSVSCSLACVSKTTDPSSSIPGPPIRWPSVA